MSTPFYERDGETRFAAIVALMTIHPDIRFHYVGDGITVSVPRGRLEDICAWARAHELVAGDDAGHYFPLGSDNPPADLRHDASYPGSRGFWLWWHCTPA